MIRILAAGVAAVLLSSATCHAEGGLAEGNWRLSQSLPAGEGPLFVLKVEKKDGKLTASAVAAGNKSGWTASDLKVDDNKVTLAIAIGGTKYTFEGFADPKDAKTIRGAMFDDSRTFRMALHAQEGDTIERPAAPKTPEQIAAVQKLNAAVFAVRRQIAQSKDQNEKADLQAKLKAAQKEVEEKSPALYRELLAKHSDSPYAVEAADELIRAASRIKPKPEELAVWAKIILDDANRYGPRIAIQAGERLAAHKETAALALPVGEKAVAALKETDPLSVQSHALKLLAAAQKAAGKNDAAIETRLAKIEKSLDDEYVKKVPPFKPEKFAGRKDKGANRVAVMELFTGAQCPPCVAADVAFDALEKAYEHKDLVLIQYHMHIPGPDPLTNPDTIARWDYYSEKFPNDIRGTPSTLFNGKPLAGGGGGMANSQKKFDEYKAIIDPLLEKTSPIKIDGAAKHAGDKVTLDLTVDGIIEPGDKVKLRVFLLEESIRYVGGNGLRFHHHVVRNVAEATPLKEKSLKKTVAFDLAGVKSSLTKYLDEYAAERAFPYPDRPMDLKHLIAIALVQDDATGEILNAVQFEVK